MALSLTLVGALLLLVPWVLYPAVVFLLARLVPRRPAPGAPPGGWPMATCVLATRDEPAIVRERVADFLAQEYPPGRLQVVVAVDAAGADALLPHLAFDDERVRVVRGDAPGGKCPALNAGVRAASGEVLVFSDARQRFAPDVVRKLVAALGADPRLGTTSGRLVLPRDEASSLFRLYSRWELALRDAEARLHSAVGVSGSVYAMPRARWAPLPAGLILDDLYTPMRLALDGARVGFVYDALAFETRRVAPGQEYRRKVRTLTGNFQMCAWLPGVLVPFRNPIWLEFVCHKLLRLATPWAAALLALGVAWWLAERAGPALPYALGVVGVGALWLTVGRDAIARKLRSIAMQFASLQAAVVTATVNGVRGRWDVWKA